MVQKYTTTNHEETVKKTEKPSQMMMLCDPVSKNVSGDLKTNIIRLFQHLFN